MDDVNPQDLKKWLDQDLAILIDVREHQELLEFSIPGAVHNPMSTFDFDAIPKDLGKKLVFACAVGIRSRQVGEYLLQENIISAAYNLAGGVAAWSEAGLPGES